jgi:hypothetical protein
MHGITYQTVNKAFAGIFKHLQSPLVRFPKPGAAASIPAGGTIFPQLLIAKKA